MVNERIYQRDDGAWYFDVRGKISVGPFEDPFDAENSLKRYVTTCRRRAAPNPSLPRSWNPFRWFSRSATRQH